MSDSARSATGGGPVDAGAQVAEYGLADGIELLERVVAWATGALNEVPAARELMEIGRMMAEFASMLASVLVWSIRATTWAIRLLARLRALTGAAR